MRCRSRCPLPRSPILPLTFHVPHADGTLVAPGAPSTSTSRLSSSRPTSFSGASRSTSSRPPRPSRRSR
eukprot:1162168-Prymnesium_polylepis.1